MVFFGNCSKQRVQRTGHVMCFPFQVLFVMRSHQFNKKAFTNEYSPLDNREASSALCILVAFKSEQDHIKLIKMMCVRLTVGMVLWFEI